MLGKSVKYTRFRCEASGRLSVLLGFSYVILECFAVLNIFFLQSMIYVLSSESNSTFSPVRNRTMHILDIMLLPCHSSNHVVYLSVQLLLETL
jgi:hypothetical protein